MSMAKRAPRFRMHDSLELRRHLWEHIHFSTSQQETDLIKIPRAVLERFAGALLCCVIGQSRAQTIKVSTRL